MAIAAGRLSNRVRIERRGEVRAFEIETVTTLAGAPSNDEISGDGFGNVLMAWSEVATRWAAFLPRFGREVVEAGRLEATLTGTLTLRRDAVTATVTAADRIVFLAGPYRGATAQIRSVVPTPDNREIELALEAGTAT